MKPHTHYDVLELIFTSQEFIALMLGLMENPPDQQLYAADFEEVQNHPYPNPILLHAADFEELVR